LIIILCCIDSFCCSAAACCWAFNSTAFCAATCSAALDAWRLANSSLKLLPDEPPPPPYFLGSVTYSSTLPHVLPVLGSTTTSLDDEPEEDSFCC